MFVDREKFMAFPDETIDCLKGCCVENVVFNNNFTDELLDKPISQYLPFIVAELTDNCVEKGAKNIYITLTNTSLLVGDDFIEPDPEKTLKCLNKMVELGRTLTTKERGEKSADLDHVNGRGVVGMVMGLLVNSGGDLNYRIEKGRIVAEATWE